MATAVGTVPSFELNRRWVWGQAGTRSFSRQVVPFCVFSFLGLALSTLTVTVAAAGAERHGVGPGPRTLVVEAANILAFGSLWVAQFVLLDRVLFRPRRTAVVESIEPGAHGSSLEAA